MPVCGLSVQSRWQAPHYLVHSDIADEVGPSSPTTDVVVLGDAGPHFTFERMNTAFRLVMGGLPLVAMAKNRYFKESDGLTLDMGAYVAALEFATGTQATVVGKPAAPFFLGALEELGAAPENALLIGDDEDPEIHPGLLANDFAEAVDFILSA